MFKKIIKFLSLTLLLMLLVTVTSCEGLLPSDFSGSDEDPVVVDENQLEQVTNIVANVVKDKVTITFNSVEGADYYKATIQKNSVLFDIIEITSGYNTTLEAGLYEFYIIAYSNDENIKASPQSKKVIFEVEEQVVVQKTALATPKNVQLNYNETDKKLTVTFDDDPSYVNASMYQVSFFKGTSLKYTKSISQSGKSIDCSAMEEDTYNIQVKVKTSNTTLYTDSEYSVAISIKIVTGQSLGGETVDPGVYTGYYADASNLKGSALESALTKIISDSHKKILTYEDLKWALQQTDEDPNNSSNLILFYCNASISKDWGGGNNWNREHVWPNSKGVGKTGPGADCHHLRPADPKVNSTRSNYKMGEVSNGTQIMYNGKGTGCYIGSSTFEPADRIKGDVARIYLYLLVRYPSLYSNLSSVANIETLIKWNALDPVDNMEVRRNNAAAVIQGNRNPFIDHPEFVNLIWKNK